MRILIIHRSLALVGGAERVITDKANYLAGRNHEVLLVSYEQGTHPVSYELHPNVKFKDLDCRFFTLSKYGIISHLVHFMQLKRKFRDSLHEVIEDFRPSVVVLASDWNFLISQVLKASGRVPVVCEFHNSYDHIIKKIGNTNSGIKAMLTKAYYSHVVKKVSRCARLISLTETEAKHWRRLSEDVSVIPNPVSWPSEDLIMIPKHPYRIIFVGRLNAGKRIDRLITAFSMIADRNPKWEVAIFGEGSEQASIERQIKSLGLEKRIIIHEPTNKIFEEYTKAQMLVLCSEYEAHPLVLIEAMSCGTPCVSFDCPSGPAEIIEDHVTGLLVKNGDVNDLADKMEWLMVHDEERKKMGIQSRIAAERYKPERIMKEWEKAYTDATGLIH